MIYPGTLTGPQFSESDLVDFIFDGAELTLPVPRLPNYERPINELSVIRDFRNIDTSHWDTDSFGNPGMRLIKQKWLFEDSVTLDDIAECIVQVSIIEPLTDTGLPPAKLNKSAYKKMVLDAMIVVSAYEGDDHADDASWPKISNEFNYQCISRPHLNGLQIQMAAVEGRKPSPYGFIPVDKRFVLSIYFAMGTLHYSNRKNPYSKELIRKLEFDLFDEYLQSINLRYSDETIELIKASA